MYNQCPVNTSIKWNHQTLTMNHQEKHARMTGSCPEWRDSHEVEIHFQLTHSVILPSQGDVKCGFGTSGLEIVPEVHTASKYWENHRVHFAVHPEGKTRTGTWLSVREQYLVYLRHWLWPLESWPFLVKLIHLKASCYHSPTKYGPSSLPNPTFPPYLFLSFCFFFFL